MAQQPGVDLITQHFGENAAAEWQTLVRHFELGEGFALILLLVRSREAAKICRRALVAFLGQQALREIRAETPDELYALPERLLLEISGEEAGAIWVEGVCREDDQDFSVQHTAWADAARRLNEHRDALRNRFAVPVILVGAPWLAVLLREQAPDLWSVRKLQVSIVAAGAEPAPEAKSSEFLLGLENPRSRNARLRQLIQDAQREGAQASKDRLPQWPKEWEGRGKEDPELALSEAATVRGQPSSLEPLARALLRAAYSFALRRAVADLERVLAELSSLPSAEGPSKDTVRQEVFLLIAYLYLLKRDGDNALKVAWHIAMDPDAPLSLRSAGWEIGCQSTILLGRWGEVHGQFELVQATSEPDLAEPEARWRRAYIEGSAYADRGRHVEAEQTLRKALVFASASAWSKPTWPMGQPQQPTGLGYSGTTRHRLGQVMLSLGRFVNAEESLRQAITELEIAGPKDNELSTCWHDLGRALIPQGRLDEAEQAFGQALLLMPPAIVGAEKKSITLEARATLQLLLGRSKEAAQGLGEARPLVEETKKSRLSLLKFKSDLANLPFTPSMGMVLRGLRAALRSSPNLAASALSLICPDETKPVK